jgi:hypothetical protein
MSDTLPPPARDADETVLVQDWEVPLVVDDEPVAITGRLEWSPDTSLPVALLPGIAIAALVGVLAWRDERVALGAVLLGAAAAAVVEWGEWTEQPSVVRSTGVGVFAAAAAIVLALAGVATRSRPRLARAIGLLGAVTTVGWALTRLDSLDEPVLPTSWPVWVERYGTSLAMGLAVAVAVVLAVRTVQDIEPFDDEPEPDRAPAVSGA